MRIWKIITVSIKYIVYLEKKRVAKRSCILCHRTQYLFNDGLDITATACVVLHVFIQLEGVASRLAPSITTSIYIYYFPSHKCLLHKTKVFFFKDCLAILVDLCFKIKQRLFLVDYSIINFMEEILFICFSIQCT